jgi:DNA-binding NarL/FixJ family response regulator
VEPITVLLVDDHAMIRVGLRSILQMEPDIQVVGEAEDGESATRLAESLRPNVVVMDIHLPGIDGIEATRRVRLASPQSAVIVLTMHDTDEFLFSAIREGAVGYLLKSLPSVEVVRAVRAAAQGESLLDPAMARKLMDGFANLSRTKESATQVVEPARSRSNELTPRETDVLGRLVQGFSNREIAQQLFLSDKTIKQHVTKILRKLGVRSRSQAIIHALGSGIVK